MILPVSGSGRFLKAAGTDNKKTESNMSKNSFVYVSTYQGPEGGGIYGACFENRTGNLSGFKKMADLEKAALMALYPDKSCLYAVGIDEKLNDPNGCIAAYSINHVTGQLRLLNKQETGAGLPTFITMTKDGKYLLQVSYGAAAGSVLRVRDDGSLEKCGRVHTFSGSGPNPVRQTRSHPHCICIHPEDNTVFVCDLGADRIIRFRLDLEQEDLVRIEPSRHSIYPGAGPRIMRFSDNGRHAYVINELGNTVSVYRYNPDNKELETQQVVSTLPGFMEGTFEKQMASEIRLHPNHEFLYVSNRSVGEGKVDGITVFKRDTSTGKLSPVQYRPTGKHPRHFNMDKQGQWLFVSVRDSDMIEKYEINSTTGELKESGTPVIFRQPWDIQFCDYEF
jgi:6-phosphogluconolactonase